MRDGSGDNFSNQNIDMKMLTKVKFGAKLIVNDILSFTDVYELGSSGIA